MSSIGDYLFRLKNQINPLDHNKTAKNPSGLPPRVPIQKPGLDTIGPTRSYGLPLTTRIPEIKEYPNTPYRKIPVFSPQATLEGYRAPTKLDWLGRPTPIIPVPSIMQKNTFTPLQYPAGDYERPIAEDYLKRTRNGPFMDYQLPVYKGNPNPVRIES